MDTLIFILAILDRHYPYCDPSDPFSSMKPETYSISTMSNSCDGRNERHASNEDDNSFSSFAEIRPEQQEQRPRTVQAYAIEVEPKDCSKIVKELAKTFPLSDGLSHLKRVRKPKQLQNKHGGEERAKKKPSLLLQVLVGAEPPCKKMCSMLDSSLLIPVTVPGRPPESHAEWKQVNNEIWPTNFSPLKSEEHKEEQLSLESNEILLMTRLMDQLVLQEVVVIVDPSNQKVVYKERVDSGSSIFQSNPLATPILLALQGVSRLEREAATKLSRDEFSKGQYLCTGYDLYTYYEPTIFEAMACVHSRLRRLVFLEGNNINNAGSVVWSQGCSKHRTHCLPGTNHKYRAFRYKPMSGREV